MTGPVTVTCPLCRAALPVPTEVVGTSSTGAVLVLMDPTPARQHVAQCAATCEQPESKAVAVSKEQPTPTSRELAGRIERVLSMRAYIAPGRRSCTMCGTPNGECLDIARRSHVGCCSTCTAGDTHPVPNGTISCAEWGAEHGAQREANQ